ncbi:MAG: hypothetical protein V7K18_15745 [Nostoc sp.]|uniref:hypothetical protein n=1 Tax=Nostoc sp. TaxID=1180 RepID=UPI002FF9A1CA
MIDAYNAALAMIDSSKTKIDEMEKSLSNLSDKLVRGVAFKYGRNSSEYEIAGGVRESDACGGLRLRVRKSRLTRLKSSIQETSGQSAQTA